MEAIELVNRHSGETLVMRRARRGGEIVLEIAGSLPAGGEGPPLHVHVGQVEQGQVMAGVLGAQVGDQTITVPAGQRAVFPANVPHRWWNAGEETLEFSGEAVPVADLDKFLQAIFAIVNAGPRGKPPLFYMAHLLHRSRAPHRLVGVPWAVQRLVFPSLVFLGSLLGKFRGDHWPGSPATCTGAPAPPE